MKTQTHTPGAWKVSSCSDGREIVSHSCGITFPIAEACDGLGKANGLKEAQSNARLIVAAPMLLKELKKILERISKGSGTGKWTADEHSDLEDLISKAEGRGA